MKNLQSPQDREELLARLQRVNTGSARQWGRMTPHQMLCHLSDSFRVVMGEKASEQRDNFLSRSLVKWIALYLPAPWPKGVKTMAASDQEREGTPPVEFERDRRELITLFERFARAQKDFSFKPHPMFGELTEAEWLRWGYLHCDHHLRQFGV
jgi:hypothetical protein